MVTDKALPKLMARKPAKKTVNFFFSQEHRPLRRKWGSTSDFWETASREQSNEAPRWNAFDEWRDRIKSGTKS